MQWQPIVRQIGLSAILAGALPFASFAATETELTPRRVQTETIKSAPAEETEPAGTDSPINGVSDGLAPTAAPDDDEGGASEDQDQNEPVEPDFQTDADIEQIDPPAFSLDPATLPDVVRATRQAILDAAENADFEALRAVMGKQVEPPILSFGGVEDPIAHLKGLAGDPDGLEILAILIEVLEAGHAHLYPGSSEGHYLWPYYAAYPTDQLTPQQRVDMFKLLTAGDYSDMQDIGSYFFFRLGISERGEWIFFVAGD